jgi:hypothetical protein
MKMEVILSMEPLASACKHDTPTQQKVPRSTLSLSREASLKRMRAFPQTSFILSVSLLCQLASRWSYTGGNKAQEVNAKFHDWC